MNDIAISVKNLSKKYHLYDSPKHRLKEALHPFRKKYHHDFWALKDVSFEVKKGESIGIIGKNGSGKSTLLQILCGVLQKTTGEVAVNGKASALLELGAGFNPELTGRENVYMNGAIMGFNKEEMDERIEAIIEFADIGEFIDQPVKIYSSGMFVRLAFALAMCVEPDILIVDEALSVGDYFFQQKCFGRLRQMRENGLTLLFVSHDMGTVRDLCGRALYLKQGMVACEGESTTAIRMYFMDGTPQSKEQIRSTVLRHMNTLDSELVKNISASALWSCAPDSKKRLVAVHVMNESGEHVTSVALGSRMVIRVYYRLMGTGLPLTIGLLLKNKYDQIIFSINNHLIGVDLMDRNDQSISAFEFELDMTIEGGLYSFKIMFVDPSAQLEAGAREDLGWLGPINIEWDYDYEGKQPPFFGMFGIPARGRSLFLDGDSVYE